MALFRDASNESEAPNWLCENVQNSEDENLDVCGHDTLTLAEEEGDGVSGPEDDEGEGELVVERSDLGRPDERVGSGRADESVEDVEHGGA